MINKRLFGTIHVGIGPLILLMSLPLLVSAQRYELVPFADFEQWTVRYLTESRIIGGQEKTLYMVAPADTVRGNVVFDYKNTIWASSNAYARVAGVTKTSTNVTPEHGPKGRCARLATQMASCKVAGLVNINVLAAGSIFWGQIDEPISGVANPYAIMDWGIPFTKRPKAMVLDFKARIPNTGTLVRSTTFRASKFDGYDPAEIVLVLQNRWEDADGNIHAKRVGTAVYQVDKTTDGWVMDYRIPVIYGDARKSREYKPYMDLITGYKNMYAFNSKGKKKVIIEEEWASPDCPVTHAIMWFSSGSCGAFIGALGNVLWVDEVRLEY